MSKQTLKGKLTISRPYGFRSDDNPFIRIAIQDEASRIEFVELEVPLASFAEALTGLSNVEANMVVRSLDKIGKRRIVESVTFELSKEYLESKGIETYNKEKIRQLLKEDPDKMFQREGWSLDTYLGSQGSIIYNGNNALKINTYYTTFKEIAE